ncbi:MAG: CvpA family protein [Candidatus Dormibacteraeota bacterium]|nr:CvpA family protein [Candidatus Dormibacteraeota bacterium]
MRSQAGPAPSSDVILDLVILVFVAGAVFVGYKYGTVQPVFALLGFVLVGVILVGHWSGFSRFLDQHIHSNGVVDALLILALAILVGWAGWKLGGFVHRMPIVRGADGLLGVVVCGLIAIWLLYGVLSLGAALGKAFDGTIGQTTTTEAQAQAIRVWVQGNPVLRLMVSTSEVQQLVQAAKTPNNPNSAISDFSSLQQLQTIYRVVFESQLRSSHLAPIVMWIGQHTPIIGHEGPSDLPSRAAPTPAVSPSVTPTP